MPCFPSNPFTTSLTLPSLRSSFSLLPLSSLIYFLSSSFLLYFFYRWETCLREATVLGMLGILSLGSLIRDARAANFYDDMVLYVLFGVALVLVGDGVSAAARALVRRSA